MISGEHNEKQNPTLSTVHTTLAPSHSFFPFNNPSGHVPEKSESIWGSWKVWSEGSIGENQCFLNVFFHRIVLSLWMFHMGWLMFSGLIGLRKTCTELWSKTLKPLVFVYSCHNPNKIHIDLITTCDLRGGDSKFNSLKMEAIIDEKRKQIIII